MMMKRTNSYGNCLSEFLRPGGVSSHHQIRHYAAATTLVEIGRLQNRLSENYQPGQMFLHKIFGFRGVVLFPWSSKLYDYDTFYKADSSQDPSKKATGSFFFPSSGAFLPPKAGSPIGFESNVFQTSYQVLIDDRDYPYMRIHKDDVCMLKNSSIMNMTLLPLTGFSNVAHDDILPYTPSGSEPFKHPYFEQFFYVTRSDGWNMKQTAELQTWRNHCLRYFKFSNIYRRTTHNVRVTVIPYYLGYGPDTTEDASGADSADRNKRYAWRYSIRIENFGDERVALREREWEIVDVYGRKEIHNGRGVIGMEPLLSRSEPAFQYSSFMYLEAPRGHMSGRYIMQRDDGTLFRCTIPLFELDSLSRPEEENV